MKTDQLRIETPQPGYHPPIQLHVRKDARERYGLNTPLYGLSGNVILADLQATRRLAEAMNRERNLAAHPDRVVRAGEINAMGLIDEILHYVVKLYRDEHGTRVVHNALEQLDDKHGTEVVDVAIRRFAEQFPPSPVYVDIMDIDAYLVAEHEGRSGRELLLEEMLMLSLSNSNPAFTPYAELFTDDELATETRYRDLIESLDSHFLELPAFGPDDQPLVEMLATPARLHPDSLQDQLSYIRERWGGLLGAFLVRLLRGLDVLREEAKGGFAGPGPSHVYRFAGEDPERFSPDKDWMPRVVILAKSTLVWLDQLAKTYHREVIRLDQIPDEELDRLADYGITGLWLIGLWERSAGSRRIKNIMGNPDAEASAYSLYDYEIAYDLGGWESLTRLRERCEARGIRLASDMVPNHTGINGRWVIEHPDWFVQLSYPPFPSYTFGGENLSGVDGVGVYLEDHYYNHSDASVVFKRVDFGNGQERFIYHGNDGTSMPWNDTAQLDFANPDVREAVIKTILHVARNFSIIRFDAAMTLAKRHIQRLWYPEPGSGGDIPSRAEHGMTADEFNAAIPQEFWREVVDRVAEEVPDTLLLAEAFWMMEGYFVRTLGMHRVYNSAFMNMLKDEENAKYRQTIKNTIEFDKEILKRFVNFMNNPDEETAIAQFGSGDKYFGVCTLMVTMPGLPMIGHGQIEGFTEKYGMEYRRAYLDEPVNRELIARHEAEIFPLMRRRHLFSGVDNFLLYDLYGDGGSVNENVFAYSNASGHERGVVIYNNVYDRTWGWIRESAGYVERVGTGKEHRRMQFADALGLSNDPDRYCVFRSHRSGLWFIRPSAQIHEQGLYVELNGYECQVYLDFHEVADNEFRHYAQLVDDLAGSGVYDIEAAVRDVALKPLHDLFGVVVNSGTMKVVRDGLAGTTEIEDEFFTRLASDYQTFLEVGVQYARPTEESVTPASDALVQGLRAAERIPFADLGGGKKSASHEIVRLYVSGLAKRSDRLDLLALLITLMPLQWRYASAAGICEEWALLERGARAFAASSHDPGWVALLKGLLGFSDWWQRDVINARASARELVADLLSNGDITMYVGLNEYEGVVWFNRERFEELAWWLTAVALIRIEASAPEGTDPDREEQIALLGRVIEELETAVQASEYRVDLLTKALKKT